MAGSSGRTGTNWEVSWLCSTVQRVLKSREEETQKPPGGPELSDGLARALLGAYER